MKRSSLFLLFVILLTLCASGCATGSYKYTPPSEKFGKDYVDVVDKNIDDVWQASVSYVADTFFVLDNIVKDSYLINLSFSVDKPEEYIDCGQFDSTVKNARGERTYRFESASKYQEYESVENGNLYRHERTIGLSGKTNIILLKIAPEKTKIKINTRYVVSKNVKMYGINPNVGYSFTLMNNFNTTLSFNTGGKGIDESTMACYPKHIIEKTIIDGIMGNL